ncbi:hypothetical protein L3X38_032392 [Prunus dulcis]|uniref:Uncharacterized protein n=1 Tax=Prunus dulcis TaxID=3755 RepID=A0AAD4YVW2_PRUDU|nr:hypothetical protein L3X38_032392 [Prunus dulcis]
MTIGIGKEMGDLHYFQKTDTIDHVFQVDGDHTSELEKVPKKFWGDAIMAVAFLINLMPSRVLDYRTPLHMLSTFHSIPSLLSLDPKDVSNSPFQGEHPYCQCENLAHLEFSDYLTELPIDEILGLGLNQNCVGLQTDIELQGESSSAVEGNETFAVFQSLPSISAPVVYKTYHKRKKVEDDTVSTELK